MFIKAFSPEHFNLGDEAQSEILYFSKRGHLSGAQEKRANMFSELTKDYVPAEGKTAVHTIAMTAFEKFGFNRNGDGWKAASLQRDHPTFVSNAKVFRHHRNTSADPSYGVVKASCYNKDMDRVELLMELDNEKCAEELSLLEKQGSYPVSMATRVPYDVCSICENKAKTPKDYCWHAKEAMGKILDDGRMVGVDNPHSVFFDISRVVRPADRLAYTLKRANANGVISGADLALELGYDDSAYQDFNATMECSFKAAAEKRQLHDKISRMEKRVPAEVRPLMLDNEQEVADTVAKLAMYGPMYFDSVMRGLMDNQVLLRPSEFYTLVTGKHLDAKTAHDLNVKAAALSQYSADELSNSAVYEPALIKVSGRIADLCKELKSYRGLGEMSPGRFDGCAKPTSHTKAASSASPEMAAWCQEYGRYMLETYRQVKEACQTDRDLESMILCGFCQNQLK